MQGFEFVLVWSTQVPSKFTDIHRLMQCIIRVVQIVQRTRANSYLLLQETTNFLKFKEVCGRIEKGQSRANRQTPKDLDV